MAKPSKDLPRMLSVAATAEWLGVSEKTVRRAINNKELAAFQPKRLIRISEDDLRLYVSRGRL